MLTGFTGASQSMLIFGLLVLVALLVLLFPRQLNGDARCFLPDLDGYNKGIQLRLRSAMSRYDTQSDGSKAWSWGLALFLVALAMVTWLHKLEPRIAVMLAAYGAAVLQVVAIVGIRRVPHSRVASLQARDALASLGLRNPANAVFQLISLSVVLVWMFLNAWPWAIASFALSLVFISLAFRCAASPSAISAQDPLAERMVDERVRTGRARTLLGIATLVVSVPFFGFIAVGGVGHATTLLVTVLLSVSLFLLRRGQNPKLLPAELAELAHDVR